MVIAVDARFLQSKEISTYFIKQLFFSLAKSYTDHRFIFLFDEPVVDLPGLPANVTAVIVGPKPTNFLLYKWWYDIKLPRVLKRYKADIFVGTNGWCSLNTKVPQLLIIDDLTFIHFRDFMPENVVFFRKKYTSSFLKKAAQIITFSNFLKHEMVNSYAVAEPKITVISAVADISFKQLDWEEREKMKERYAQGCEYFIFRSDFTSQTDLFNILKAFSIFKKWQKTNMKLVISTPSKKDKDNAEKLNAYKYKNELNIIENLSVEALAEVTGGAYAMLCASYYKNSTLTVLEAMQCGVPIITSPDSSMAEVAADAALYANPHAPEEIAEQMKRLFKDEQLRSKLASIGKERAKLYNLQKTTELAWAAINKTVSR